MDDNELRQAMGILESYNGQMESLNRQAQVLQMTLEEAARARDTFNAIGEAKQGDEIMVPVGAMSYVKAVVTEEKTAVVGIGNRLSVEKSLDDAMTFMNNNIKELSEAIKVTSETIMKIESATSNLRLAVQAEYQRRSQEPNQ